MGEVSLKEKVYEQILLKIIKNEFPIDEFIVESQLTKMFNVSRTTIREALIELCNDGILRNIARTGYQIVKITGKEIKDAFQVRLLLEIEGVKLALKQITDKDIERLEKLTLEGNEDDNDSSELTELEKKIELNSRFHLQLNALSRNSVMNNILKDILNFLRRAIAQIIIYQMDLPAHDFDTSYHFQIIKALRERNKNRVTQLLRKDIQSYEKLLREYV